MRAQRTLSTSNYLPSKPRIARKRTHALLPSGLPKGWVVCVYVATGTLMICAPFSVATALNEASLLKWVRTIATIVGCGFIVGYLPYRLGKEFGSLLAFAAVYTMAAIWSDAPLDGLLYKGLLIPTFFLAWGLAAIEKTGAKEGGPWWTFRFITMAGCVVSALLIHQVYTKPELAISSSNRMSSYGINSNSIAQSLAPIGVISLLGFRHDASKWRRFHALSCVLTGMALIGTGSRGGLGVVIIGFTADLFLTKRLTKGIVTILLLVGVIFAWWSYSPIAEGASRLWQVDFRTRLPRWEIELQRFQEAPVFGHGWLYETGRRILTTQTVLNAYLQIAVEAGLMGLLAFVACHVRMGSSVVRRLKAERRVNTVTATTLGVSLYLAMLAHGMVETSILMPSALPSFFWAFAAALCSIRIPPSSQSAKRKGPFYLDRSNTQ